MESLSEKNWINYQETIIFEAGSKTFLISSGTTQAALFEEKISGIDEGIEALITEAVKEIFYLVIPQHTGL